MKTNIVSWVLLATTWKKREGRKDFCLGQNDFEEAGSQNYSSSLELDLFVQQTDFFDNAKRQSDYKFF